MKLWKSWAVAQKDFAVFRRKKYVIYSLVAMPLVLALLLPGTLLLAAPGAIPEEVLALLINAEFSIFVLMAAILPTIIASYSIVGEKLEKSLEPLLATPTTDTELLLGKGIAAFVPTMVATYMGAAIFMAFVDALTIGNLGYLLMPNWNVAVILLLAAPLACIMSVEFSVIISSRVNDVRAAQQLGSLVILPLLAIFLLGELNILPINANNLLVVSAILLAIDVGMLFLSRSTFQREEILTKWK